MLLPSAGDAFQARYDLLDILGEGGNARVYRARDRQMQRDVVVKIMTPKAGTYTDSAARRFMREAAVLAQLTDPHTVTLFDFGQSEDGLQFMVFEYVAGRDLTYVLNDGPLPWKTAIHVLKQLLSSLAEAHSRGVVHRDIKPPNILIHTYDNDPYAAKLLDFGIALTLTQDVTRLTQDGAVVGTLRYMSPEQLAGEPIRPTSDIYSLGMVAYEMLVGASAVMGSTHEELGKQILSQEPWVLPQDVAPAPVCAIIERMMARTVDRRYASAHDVLSAFRAAEAKAAKTKSAAVATPPLPDHRTRRSLGVAVVLVSLVIVAALIAMILALRKARDVPAPVQPTPPPAVVAKAPAQPSAPKKPESKLRVVEEDAGSRPDFGERPILVPIGEPSKGCGKNPLLRGAGDLRFDPDEEVDVDRYDAYIPHGYRINHPQPLLLLLHESGDPPPEFIQYSGFIPIAERVPMVIIAPFDGDNLTQAWGDETDAKRIRSAIKDATNTLCIDTGRIFVVGHASGGRMATRTVCEVGGVAAIATTAFRGSVRGHKTICFPKDPVPYLHIAGKLDQYSPFEGGEGCAGSVKISIDKKEGLWRKRNRCKGKRRSWFQYGENRCDTWDCDVPFVSCRLDGGRQWAGSTPRVLPRLLGHNCDGRQANFPFADTIWRFFMQHTRP